MRERGREQGCLTRADCVPASASRRDEQGPSHLTGAAFVFPRMAGVISTLPVGSGVDCAWAGWAMVLFVCLIEPTYLTSRKLNLPKEVWNVITY